MSARWTPPAPAPGALRALVGARLRQDRARVAAALTAVLVSAAALAAMPAVVRSAIDDGIDAGDRGALNQAVAVLLGLVVVGGVADGTRAVLMTVVGQRFLHRLRCDSLAGAMRIDVDEHESAERGDLQARVSTDVEALAGAAEHLVPASAGLAVTVAAGIVGVAILSPLLALLALLAIPPAIVAGLWLRRRSRVVYPALMAANATAVGRTVEMIEGAETIAALRGTGVQRDRLRAASAVHIAAAGRAATMHNGFYSALLIVQAVTTALVVVAGSLLASRETITVGTAAAAILALAAVFGPLSLLVGQLDELMAVQASLVRVAGLALIPERVGSGAPLPGRGELRLDGVSFAYGPGAPVLRDVTLSVGEGERVALVGETGAGKSTLARVAVGLARPSAGTVRLGGADVRAASPADRRRLLMVAQEGFLVDGTIAANVRLADPGLPAGAVEEAVERLGLREWIDALPDGIHTEVGPAGGRLSAGERQLVALLRVVLADPAVVVLDEATSVLDAATERVVAAALARALVGRAVLVVAHRQATAARCDRIAVLEAGRLVALGTHAGLSACPGPYARLWTGAGEVPR